MYHIYTMSRCTSSLYLLRRPKNNQSHQVAMRSKTGPKISKYLSFKKKSKRTKRNPGILGKLLISRLVGESKKNMSKTLLAPEIRDVPK